MRALLNRLIPPLFRGGIAFLSWLLAVTLIAQVFFRYSLNNSLVWGEEFARYTLIVLVFIGAIQLVWNNSLTAFGSSEKTSRSVFEVVARLPARFFFFSSLAVSAGELMWRSSAQKSIALGLPMALVFAPILLFALCSVGFCLTELIGHFKSRRKDVQ
jgi:TRAP-type C4-dicarboxylate transport system permease small subunit